MRGGRKNVVEIIVKSSQTMTRDTGAMTTDDDDAVAMMMMGR